MPRRKSILRFTPPRDEPQLAREKRRAKGIYYTPPEIVRWIVTRTAELLPGRKPLRVLDPACGAGAFLVEAQRQLRRSSLFGIDCSPAAVAAARQAVPKARISHCDFLDSSVSPQPFDLILGNPPYVNIRELAKATSAAYRDRLRNRYKTARGNFDLYPLFLDHSLSLLRSGGVCGMIVPNKWAGLDYARPLREMLLAETTLHDIVDLSSVSVFAAAEVYPQILIFQKQPPAKTHAVKVRSIAVTGDLLAENRSYRLMPQSLLSPRAIILSRALDIESRIPTEPLGERATLHSGASGYTAENLARLLREKGATDDSRENTRDFIVSGNIDRYSIEPGNVRYMKRTFRLPVLDLHRPELSAAKRRLYQSPKIVIAGMSRRIEAAYDERGLALGVQVYAAAHPLDDPYYLLALLNSRLMSFLFQQRFAAKKLAGGYLAMNKGQLEQLPIRVKAAEEAEDREWMRRLVELAARGSGVFGVVDIPRGKCSPAKDSLPLGVDGEIDQLVYQLYRLTAAEIRQVDAGFDERRAKAA